MAWLLCRQGETGSCREKPTCSNLQGAIALSHGLSVVPLLPDIPHHALPSLFSHGPGLCHPPRVSSCLGSAALRSWALPL